MEQLNLADLLQGFKIDQLRTLQEALSNEIGRRSWEQLAKHAGNSLTEIEIDAFKRAADRPHYMANVIAQYLQLHKVDYNELLVVRKWQPLNFMRLIFCRIPTTPEGIAQIAAYTQVPIEDIEEFISFTNDKNDNEQDSATNV